MKITIYDGADTIGGNKIHIEDNGKGLFLDFGLNFARYGKYYEEFLSERISRGIYDLWNLNLIPHLNIYRRDLIPRDLDASSYKKIPINGVLLSHGHLDHAGNVSFLRDDIPVVLSPVTAIILKALNDTSVGSHLGVEIPHFREREINEDYTVSAKRGESYKGREIFLTEKSDIKDFLLLTHGRKKIAEEKIDFMENGEFGFELESYPVDHSIPGSMGFIVNGEMSVAYTGDFRLHGKRGEQTRKFIKKAKKATILITEGTRVGRDDERTTEEDVYQNSLEIVENTKKFVIADFSPRNFDRLESFYKISRKTGREIVITSKDAYFIHFLSKIDKNYNLKDFKIYKPLKTKVDSWEKFIMKIYGENYISPFILRENGEHYILCFSFYDMPHLLDIKPRGGVYIYSSSEAFTEEQVFSFHRLWNWLKHFKMEVRGFNIDKNGDAVFERGFHASGHISQDELFNVIEEIDPDYVIPVHTEKSLWFKDNFENSVILKNGESREF